MNFPILLPSLKCSLKSGQENLTYFGKNTNFRLIDFWRWSMSNILSNSTRGKLAEFIAGTAVGTDFASPRDEWECFDIKKQKKKKCRCICFCLLKHRVQDTINPLNLEFFIKIDGRNHIRES